MSDYIMHYENAVSNGLREELSYLERLNPCDQKYYQKKTAFLIQYRQRVDVFNFLPQVTLRMPINIIGKPYSVSQKGYWGENDHVSALIREIKGLSIVLNGDAGLTLPFAFTLSSHVFYNRFTSFEQYMGALRSHYRYRVKKALQKGTKISVRKMSQQNFTKEHYDLYLEVYQNSKDKLECLSMAFFKTFPSEFYEFRSRDTDRCLGFVQLVHEGDTLTFLFGGFKHAFNHTHDLYMNMLVEIIRIGIERGVATIEFGQTAEETKLKLGCVPIPKYLYVHHSNRMLHFFIAKLLPLLSYRPHGTTYNVFKENT